ncbi:MAG: hypothetical protein ACKOKG_10735, partial [Verrucomicrobiota bacterium]
LLGMAAESGEEIFPFLDEQAVGRGIYWQKLKRWITRNEELYELSHYARPKTSAEGWTVAFSGELRKPCTLSVDDIKGR